MTEFTRRIFSSLARAIVSVLCQSAGRSVGSGSVASRNGGGKTKTTNKPIRRTKGDVS
jgi:hypothetical protein